MEKKLILLIILSCIVPFVIASSVPQFLMLQGSVKIDGRIAPNGTVIRFSIDRIEVASSIVSDGKYRPVFIQGFSNLYGKLINITISDGVMKHQTQQKINYIYPQEIYLNLSTLTENALKISGSSPSENTIIIQKTETQKFIISTTSGYNDSVDYIWFLDGSLVSNKPSYNYTIGNYDSGKHNITAIASDGYLTLAREWGLEIKKPLKGSFDGSTTNFNSLKLDELENVKNVILEKKSKGKIEFLEGINFTGIDNLDNIVKIENDIVAVDSKNYPGLNKPAKITITGLSYNSIPKIYYDGSFTTNPGSINTECDFCEIMSYTNFPTTNGTIIFNTEHFTSFYAKGGGEIYNFSELGGLATCENGEQGNLTISIKKPGEGDDIKPGEITEIKVKVKNNNDKKKKIVVESTLYNLDEENDEENAKSDSQKISAGKSETFEMEIEFPDDFDEEDDYILFVKAYEKNEEENQCNQEAVGINLGRDNNDLKIKKIKLSPTINYPGKNIDVFIDVENQGSDDEEDIYLTARNSQLEILEKIGPFEIEGYGGHNSLSEILSFKIPENAEEGNYNLTIEVEGDESDDSVLAEFSVKAFSESIKSEKIVLNPILAKKMEINFEKLLETPENFYSIVILVLFAGIIFLFVLIVMVTIIQRR